MPKQGTCSPETSKIKPDSKSNKQTSDIVAYLPMWQNPHLPDGILNIFVFWLYVK